MTTSHSPIGSVEKILGAINNYTSTIKDIHFHQHSNEVLICLKRKNSFKQQLIESIKKRKKTNGTDRMMFLKVSHVEDFWMGYHEGLAYFDITDIHYDATSKLLLIASENAPFELMIKTTSPEIEILEREVNQLQLNILIKNKEPFLSQSETSLN